MERAKGREKEAKEGKKVEVKGKSKNMMNKNKCKERGIMNDLVS